MAKTREKKKKEGRVFGRSALEEIFGGAGIPCWREGGKRGGRSLPTTGKRGGRGKIKKTEKKTKDIQVAHA